MIFSSTVRWSDPEREPVTCEFRSPLERATWKTAVLQQDPLAQFVDDELVDMADVGVSDPWFEGIREQDDCE